MCSKLIRLAMVCFLLTGMFQFGKFQKIQIKFFFYFLNFEVNAVAGDESKTETRKKPRGSSIFGRFTRNKPLAGSDKKNGKPNEIKSSFIMEIFKGVKNKK